MQTTTTGLHPESTVYFVRHGHALARDEGQPDIARRLSEVGAVQALQLSKTFGACGIPIDLALTSAAIRAQQTAQIFREQRNNGFPIFPGIGHQLYAPALQADADELFALDGRILGEDPKKWFSVAPKLLLNFASESREIIHRIDGIGVARNIAIFGHTVTGQPLLGGLFPQHWDALMSIQLDPCDCIRVTADKCQLFKLLR